MIATVKELTRYLLLLDAAFDVLKVLNQGSEANVELDSIMKFPNIAAVNNKNGVNTLFHHLPSYFITKFRS